MKNARSRSPEEAQRIPGAPVRVQKLSEHSRIPLRYIRATLAQYPCAHREVCLNKLNKYCQSKKM